MNLMETISSPSMATLSQCLGLFEILRSVQVFEDLSDIDLLELIPILKTHVYRKGETVLEAQSPTDDVFVVCSGRLTMHSIGLNGKKIVIRNMGDSEIFGDAPIFEGHGPGASITADVKSVLVSLGQEEFLTLLTQHPLIALRHLKNMSLALRTMTQRVSGFMSLKAPLRVQQVLLECAKSDKTGLHIERLPTHSEIAIRAYTQREVVNKELNRLIRSGVIVKSEHELLIPQPQLLEAFRHSDS